MTLVPRSPKSMLHKLVQQKHHNPTRLRQHTPSLDETALIHSRNHAPSNRLQRYFATAGLFVGPPTWRSTTLSGLARLRLISWKSSFCARPGNENLQPTLKLRVLDTTSSFLCDVLVNNRPRNTSTKFEFPVWLLRRQDRTVDCLDGA